MNPNEITNQDIAQMTPEQRLANAGQPHAMAKVSEHGTISAEGASAVDRMRMIMILQGLKMESRGMRMTRKAPTCLSIVKKEFGIKARTAKDAMPKFKALLVEFGVILTDAERERFKDEEEKTPGA